MPAKTSHSLLDQRPSFCGHALFHSNDKAAHPRAELYLNYGGISLLPSHPDYARHFLFAPAIPSIVAYAESPLAFSFAPISVAILLTRLSDYNRELHDIWGVRLNKEAIYTFVRRPQHILHFAPYTGVNYRPEESFWVLRHPSVRMYDVTLDDFLSSYIQFDSSAPPPILASFLGDLFEEMLVIRDIFKLIDKI